MVLRQLVDAEILQLRERTELNLDQATYFRIVEGQTASLRASLLARTAIERVRGLQRQRRLVRRVVAEVGRASS